MARTSVEERIFALLIADTAVKAIVVDRVYPIAAKQAALLPQIVFRRVSTERIGSLLGESGLEHVRVQVDCQATTYLAAKVLAGAVLDAMDAATVFDCEPDNQVDQYESDPEIFIVSLDFMIFNAEE
jgi:hypothetical protein